MQVRPASRDDAATLVAFQIAMAQETEGLTLDPRVVTAGVDAVFASSDKGRYFVAIYDERIVGALLLQNEWSDWRNGTVLWIHSVYVLPEARRRGVYRAMYAHLQELVRGDPRYRGLRLFVDKRNRRAQAVYEDLGMDGSHYALYEWLKP